MKKEKGAERVVLIADGDAEARKNIRNIIRDIGMMVPLEVQDGPTAFRVMKTRSVDFVIADWDLAQMNGLTLLKVIQSDHNLQEIPFIIMSSKMTMDRVVEAGKAGVSGILMKPFSRKSLEDKLKSFEERPENPGAFAANRHFIRGKELMDAGRFDEALEEFKLVLRLFESAEVYFNMGYIKAAQERYDEAIYYFRRATEINNMHARAFKMMGDVFVRKGNPAMAEKFYAKAGEIFLSKDERDEAEHAFREALKIDPNSINIYNNLGILYRRKKDYERALIAYARALKVDPNDENIRFNLGRAYLEMGNIDFAEKWVRSALKINPEFPEANGMIEDILRRRTEGPGTYPPAVTASISQEVLREVYEAIARGEQIGMAADTSVEKIDRGTARPNTKDA